MEYLKPEFLSQLGIAPHVVDLIIVAAAAFLIAWKWRGVNDSGEIRGLKTHKDFLEAKVRDALDKNAGESKTIVAMQAEFDELRKLVESKAPLSALEPALKAAVDSTSALASANTTVHHILSAETGMFGVSGMSANAEIVRAPKNRPK